MIVRRPGHGMILYKTILQMRLDRLFESVRGGWQIENGLFTTGKNVIHFTKVAHPAQVQYTASLLHDAGIEISTQSTFTFEFPHIVWVG